MPEQEYKSASTSINTVNKVYTKCEFKRGSKVLDWGGGEYDTNKQYMAKKGVNVGVYDPFNRSKEHNMKVLENYVLPNYIVCSNVLNVIKEESIVIDVLQKMKLYSRPGTIIYIAIYEGDRSGIGKQSKKDSWQRNEKAGNYKSIIEKVFGVAEGNAIVTKKENIYTVKMINVVRG